jgi:phosphatidylethanolamine/phosphatidyl-N-methylethanolamine N-methyltransferase
MSTTTIELYYRLAPVYDMFYGATLQPGRRRALERLAPQPGESILEIGAGTGFGLDKYPKGCRVVAIDLSPRMITRAGARLRRHRLEHIHLCRMDAIHLAFPDQQFDAVYAPYVVNVVPDPVLVGREMLRVCRPGGRLVLLNHFEGVAGGNAAAGRIIGRLATAITGVNWGLDLDAFVADAGLTLQSIEPVNFGRVSSVVLCRKP